MCFTTKCVYHCRSMKVWKQLLAKSGQSLVVSEEATEATADPLTTGNIPNLVSTVDKVNTSIISIIMCLLLDIHRTGR